MSTYETVLARFQSARQRFAQGDLVGALADFDAIIAIKPDLEEVYTNRGVVLRELNRFEEALASFDRAIEINPELAPAYIMRGSIRTELGLLMEALADLDYAIAHAPRCSDAYNNRGTALRRLNRLSEALNSYDEAIALDPASGEAWSNRGELYDALQKPDAAIENFRRAITLMPRRVDALIGFALVLQKNRRFREAEEMLNRAAAIDPAHRMLLFAKAHGALQSCNWDLQDVIRPRLEMECQTGKAVIAPLALLGYLDNPAILRVASARYLDDLLGPHAFSREHPRLAAHDKIRLGYFSNDFHEHATAYLIANLIEQHDRSRFEVIAFSFGQSDGGGMRARLERAFDQFIDVSELGDVQVVELSRKLEIDIAIDLKGFTAGERPGIFSRRAAPIQVNYLGYPGTMAADCWDYIVSDSIVLPYSEQPDFSEQIVHLGCCYQPNDPTRIRIPAPPRDTQGLPPETFVFCCFNSHYKITRPIFDIWMRLLNQIPRSVLWLLEGSASDTLRHEAANRGVAPERLVFAPLVDQASHLARLALADLVLDTIPYNAHTTASDALWAGVPVLTCRGKSFAGRVAASLLSEIELPELITEDLPAYEAQALKLARDAGYRDIIHRKLLLNRDCSTLFDPQNLRRRIEAAFAKMIDLKRAGRPPQSFEVSL